MPHYSYSVDVETAERVGAGSTFQVITIVNEDGVDVTDALAINVGYHYRNEEELKAEIAKKLNVPPGDVSLSLL